METQDRSVTDRNGDAAVGACLHVVREQVQDPDPARHLQRGLHLHTRPDPKSAQPVRHRRPHALRLRRRRERERLHGEGGGHVLSPAGGDFAGGDEHEADLAAGVEQLEGAVVVGEDGAVRVVDGDVLGEGEADGGVVDGEGRELDGVDGEVGVLGLEDGEVDDAGDDDEEDEEDGGDDAGGQVGTAAGAFVERRGLPHCSIEI